MPLYGMLIYYVVDYIKHDFVDLLNKYIVILVIKNVMILIADDDPDDQLFIRNAFQRNDFAGTIECVEDGNKLIEYLHQQARLRPNLILLDLNMPFKDGYKALEEIKEDPVLSHIPVAVLTSSSRYEDEPKCYRLGCQKFFRKPLTLHEYDKLAADILDYVKNVQ